MNFTGISGQNDRKVSLCSKYITTKKMQIIHSAFSLCSLKSIMGMVFDWRISNMYYLDQAGFEDENLCIVFFSVVNLWNNSTIYFQSCFKAVIFILSFRHQVPLHLLVKKFLGDYPNYGNMVVWLSIILGQPLAILTYVHDYYITHQ